MIDVKFKAWGKIPRENPFNVTISEKIDGTNACIVIYDEEIAQLAVEFSIMDSEVTGLEMARNTLKKQLSESIRDSELGTVKKPYKPFDSIRFI